jgi:hypothetical protein
MLDMTVLTAALLCADMLFCRWDRKYWATYKVLDILQKVFYRSNPAREAFVEMCEDSYVQKMTFDSYLYKTVVPGGPCYCCCTIKVTHCCCFCCC